LERVTRGSARPATASLDALKRLGVSLAVDDFGTGYSSLSHVRRLPVDVLKIDQSFVAGLGRNSSDTSIVQAVIGLAHAMGLTPIAEGVERPEQARALLEFGCDLAQGYLYARALPAGEVDVLLDADVSVWGSAKAAS
jgi:EAL domain-containing protein (putative c-di-GMP-specific phosphodiesterase class I)